MEYIDIRTVESKINVVSIQNEEMRTSLGFEDKIRGRLLKTLLTE